MLPAELLSNFASTLGAGARAAPFEWEARGIPGDVGRLLAAVGGARCGELRFLELTEVEAVRARMEGAAHALWNVGWYPIAQSSSALYAYAPRACFRGPPGQVLCFDVDGGDCWEGYRSLAFWLGALLAARGEVSEARRWAAARKRLFRVELPSVRDGRFELPPTFVSFVGDEIEQRDCTLFVLHALSVGRKPGDVLGELARALDEAVPYCNLSTLARATLDDVVALARSWFVPLLGRHAAKKQVTELRFGVEYRASVLHLWAWPGTPTVAERLASSTPCLRELCGIIDTPEVGFSSETESFTWASAAFLVSALLEEAARALPWEGPLNVMLERTQLGICDRDGFVPTPLSIARAQLAEVRQKTAAGLRQMSFPGQLRVIDHPEPVAASEARRLRHPDGRAWEIVIGADTWQCTMIDSSGERDTFTRALETGWEAETLIAAQRRASFVEG